MQQPVWDVESHGDKDRDLLMVLHHSQDGVNGAEDPQSHHRLLLVLHILVTLENPDEYFSLRTHTLRGEWLSGIR